MMPGERTIRTTNVRLELETTKKVNIDKSGLPGRFKAGTYSLTIMTSGTLIHQLVDNRKHVNEGQWVYLKLAWNSAVVFIKKSSKANNPAPTVTPRGRIKNSETLSGHDLEEAGVEIQTGSK